MFIFIIAVFTMGLMVGCAGMEKGPDYRGPYAYYPPALVDADRSLDEARTAGKDKACPAEFNTAKDMVDKAYQVYLACHTQEAIDMANEAMGKIKALCPAVKQSAIKEEEPVVIVVAEPKAQEKVVELASERKEKVVVLALEDVHFNFDKSTLTNEAQAILKKDLQILQDNPKAKVLIAGYTSASGTAEYNMKLSERRANAVKDYLVAEGIITPDRLSEIGYGKTDPAMYEATPKDLYSKAAKANMRVLFTIVVK